MPAPQADTEQQHTLLGRRDNKHKVKRPDGQCDNHADQKIERHPPWIRCSHRQRSDHCNHHHTPRAGCPAGPQPEQATNRRGNTGTQAIDHRMMAFGRNGLNRRITRQNILFDLIDAAVGLDPFDSNK